MNKSRKAIKLISVLLLVGVLAFVAYELFQIRNITVSGCETVSKDAVITSSGLKAGESIFSVDSKKVMDLIASDPYVKPVSVTVEYPDSVAITIKERKEAACIRRYDTILVIDDECYLLKVLSPSETVSYPEVTGLSLDGFNIGEMLHASDPFQLDVLSSVLSESDASGIGLKSIDLSIAADVTLEINDGYTVELGDDTNLEKKFQLIEASARELQGKGKTGGIIDVVSANEAYYRQK